MYKFLSALIIVFYICLAVIAGFYSKDFKLDASSDTLTLENNKKLDYYRLVKNRYGSDDFLIIAFLPNDKNILSQNSLTTLKNFTKELKTLANIEDITSILNIPLIYSPKVSLSKLASSQKTIENTEFLDLNLVRKELTTSPIYKNLLASIDADATTIIANFRWHDDENLIKNQQADIAKVRQIVKKYQDNGKFYIGGVPMIVADSIDFVKSDLIVFGIATLLLIIGVLFLIFRKFYLVLLSIANCGLACLIMLGFLGFASWPVTVVSSNFAAILIIITLSLNIHLINRYKEDKESGISTKAPLLLYSIKHIIKPCFFTAFTTIIAFSSLIISGVKPVIDFGWMMSIGIVIAFIVTFSFFPACLFLLEKKFDKQNIKTSKKTHKDFTIKLAEICSNIIFKHSLIPSILFFALAVACIYGLTGLKVENSFIDYYKEDTEIYQGMSVIDRKLGGTTPLDIIIDAPNNKDHFKKDLTNSNLETGYWYNSFIAEDIIDINNYLEDLPEIGKVLSIGTLYKILYDLNDDDIDSLTLNLAAKKMSKSLKDILVNPYISADGNQIRFSARIIESSPTLNRANLIAKIKEDISSDFGIKKEDIKLSGMLVLYEDLLQSLYKSQILTLGAVFAAIFIMFIIIFRSLKLALLAIIPNIYCALVVLGIMGVAGIPLDIMTITIAAICIGIGVDNTIHFIYRFKEERQIKKDTKYNIEHSLKTIGKAMYFTSTTIACGFSILVLSNFVPTIYFGLLTALSVFIALLADLILLPILLKKAYTR